MKKYILTKQNNEIIEISNTYELDEEYRNIIVDNRAIAYGPNEVINMFEVEEIPKGVEIAKYCYTEEKGFYKNENYVEPINEEKKIEELEHKVKTLTKENKDLSEQITEIQLAMIEISEVMEV